jgi:hypothetical protein
MTSHRTILMTLISLTTISFAMPSAVLAGPLLGGYGGPGEGNQAILGSALIGGGGGSGGASGGSGSNGSAGSAGSSASAAAGAGGAGNGEAVSVGSNGRGSKAGRAGGPATGQTSGSLGGSGKASDGAARAYPALSRDAGSGALGSSADDLLYLLLALVVLLATGVVTKRLVQAPTRPEGL